MRRHTQKTALVTLSDINITPLLDLAFVLLIIFMITTPLMEQGLRLQLPKSQVTDVAPDKRDLKMVEVNPAGEYYLETLPITLADLKKNLA
ncbi:MAG: ExbD/TolR family protein, partial [Limisphaerales bacterium]